MRPTAWQFTCSRVEHPRLRYGTPVVLNVKGDKAEAMKAARAKGWRPCTEAMGSRRRSLLHWWCPECVAAYR